MVIERYFPIWGGAENQLRQLSRRLVDLGCKVTVVTRRWKKDMSIHDSVDNIPIVRVGWPGNGLIATLGFTASLTFYLLHKGKTATVIHTHGAAALGALGSLVSRLSGPPNIAKIATAGRIPKLARSLPGRLILKLLKDSNAIICMTKEIQKELHAIHTSPQRIFHVANGVDGKRFRPLSDAQRREWRVARGLAPESPLVVFSGRLVHRKGIDVLFAAWHQVAELYPSAYLFVLGSGIDQLDSIENQVRWEIRQKGVTNVTFVGDTQAPESYLNIADIFVFPSRKEGFPNALLEGMASGLAIVASEIGGVVDLVENGKTGLLFPCGDAMALSSKIIELLHDPQKRKSLGSCSRQHVLKYCSLEDVSRQYFEAYKRLKGFEEQAALFRDRL